MENDVRKNNEVSQYIERLPDDIQSITNSVRELILENFPELKEEYKWSMPNYSYKGLVCYLQASKKHLNVGFHKGNELEVLDKNKLLQGSGKTMRHIRIKKQEEIKTEVLIPLIQAAIKLNEK
ncbi:hypothetical protein GGQ92_002302 [Gracilibacillus halotolerans]|uniref:YdhG-like domain-containing protein n=1 Tax=Gracilibacillus halotolerans TaxID=74386 RepID=A0A841RH51_9BACI|nr:DUF1801 domain-containing protein [Gracilibacillus halotolerans]MBB6513490.1 hypothetical protein [Gracilibacillus halotolerans]